jgi:hypothetical protein
MTRTIQDQELQLWEAYASAAASGSRERARIVFQCLTDTSRRARELAREGDKAAVEKEVATLPDYELLGLLAAAEELK